MSWNGLITHHLIFNHFLPLLPKEKPMIAIIVDDLGYDMSVVKSLINLEIPLNYAILPYLPYSKEIAQLVSINIFVDSFTTPKSIAYKLAQEMGVKSLIPHLM